MRHMFFFASSKKWKSPFLLLPMVNHKISANLKECALQLWDTGWDEEDICSALLVPCASLFFWRAIFNTFGTVNKPPSLLKGQTSILTAIHQLYETTADLYLDELVWWLALHHYIMISCPALQQNLQQAGLTWKLLWKLALERDPALRLEWKEFVLEHGKGQACEFVVIDEMSKNDHSTACCWGHAISGECAELTDVFVQGDHYLLVAAMTVDGYIAMLFQVHPMQWHSMILLQNLWCDHLLHLQQYLLTAVYLLLQMNPWTEEQSILVLDNCRIHHNDLLHDFIHNAGELVDICITIAIWCNSGWVIVCLPPYSPRLTLIEESFNCCMSFTLSQYVMHLFTKIPQ